MRSIVAVVNSAILAALLLVSSSSFAGSRFSAGLIEKVDAAPASFLDENGLPPHEILFNADDEIETEESHAGFAKRQVSPAAAAAAGAADAHTVGTRKNNAIRPLHLSNSTTLRPNMIPGVISNPNNGVVMHGNQWGVIPVLITYGAFDNGDVAFLQKFVQNLEKSNRKTSWWALSTQYYDQTGYVGWPKLSKVVNAYGGKTPLGLAYPDNVAIIKSLETSKVLKLDPNAIYVVLTGKNVAPAGPTAADKKTYCSTSAQGWTGVHSYFTRADGSEIIWALIPHGSRCYDDVINSGYTPQSINGKPYLDYMASVLAHELTEAATDPFADAWGDNNGNENADKCYDEFGPTTNAVVGGKTVRWNIALNGQKYLIQQNWGLVKQKCLSAP